MPVTISGIRSTSTFAVRNGGTGATQFDEGGVLIGHGTNPVTSVTGSDGQVLTWSDADNSWVAAAPSGGGGGGGASTVTTSGNLQGTGTAGSPVTLKANISLTSVTASLSGNGANVTNISTSNIASFSSNVRSQLSGAGSISYDPSTGIISASLSSGGGLSTVNTTGNLEGDGSSGSPVALKANISLTSVTASLSGDGAAITGLASSQLSDFNSAVDARITNIPNAALQNNSITINGSPVSLGGSVTIATSSANQTFTSITAATGTVSGDLTVQGNLFVNGAQTVVNTTDLTITDNVILIASGAVNAAQLDGAGIHFGRLPSEDARIIYDSVNDWMEIYPGVSASLYTGNGAGLVNISSSQISNFNTAVDARITNIPNGALQNSSITINGSSVSLGGTVTVADASIMTFTASGFSAGDIVALSGSLVKADYSDNMKSNAFGVVSSVSGNTVNVRVFGEITANGASSYSTVGTLVYVGANGAVTNYAGVGSGKYLTQIGIISSSGKIIIQPRIFGQLA